MGRPDCAMVLVDTETTHTNPVLKVEAMLVNSDGAAGRRLAGAHARTERWYHTNQAAGQATMGAGTVARGKAQECLGQINTTTVV
jgi:hypothetical protein